MRKPPLTPVGIALRDLRFDMRLQQRELAELLGISRLTLGRWEKGQASPSRAERLRVIEWLADAPQPAAKRLAVAGGTAHGADAEAKAEPPLRARSALRAAVPAAVRAAADDLDVTAASVRRALAGVLPLCKDAGLDRVEDVIAAM